MIWQDIVVAVANVMFMFSLSNQVYYGFKNKKGYILLKTSGITSFGLYAMAVSFITLDLFWSASATTLSATLWLILFIQRLSYRKA